MALARRVWMAGLAWLLYALPGCAQHWSFQMYGTDQGLTNPTILALQQDRQGYLWATGCRTTFETARPAPPPTVPACNRAFPHPTRSARGSFAAGPAERPCKPAPGRRSARIVRDKAAPGAENAAPATGERLATRWASKKPLRRGTTALRHP